MTDKDKEKYLNKIYKKRFGCNINWKNPQKYTEKIQFDKIYGNLDYKIKLADKYEVRKWVENKIGKEYLIDLLGKWNNVDEIDFNTLPNQFVLKTNCSSGDTIIVKNKAELSDKEIKKIKQKLNFYLTSKYGMDTLELQYSKMKPMIIAEKYIETKNNDLYDYKFLCFDGTPHYCWLDMGRFDVHRRNFYDLNWNLQNWSMEYPNFDSKIEKPEKFEEMIEIAKKLSNDFEQVRVDLYNVNGKIYFGEMTFSNSSGMKPYVPESADYMLGKLWNLPKK